LFTKISGFIFEKQQRFKAESKVLSLGAQG
jgi:hypothetical protein